MPASTPGSRSGQIATDNLDLYGGDGNITGTVYLPSARLNFKNGIDDITQVVAQGLDLNPGDNTTQIGAPLTIAGPATIPDGTNGQVYPATQLLRPVAAAVTRGRRPRVTGLTIDTPARSRHSEQCCSARHVDGPGHRLVR